MTGPPTKPWRRFERRMTGRFTAPERAPLTQVLKAAAAAIITWFSCEFLLSEPLPIFGAIAAILCVQESVDQSLTRGIERVIGVLLGVSVALGAGALFGVQSWLFIAAILVAMAVGWALRMTTTATNQIAITALLMIALGGLEVNYGMVRLVETGIGAAIGVIINALLIAPVGTVKLERSIRGLTYDAADALDALAETLEAPRDRAWLDDMYAQARALAVTRTTVQLDLRRARESLRLNPRSARHRERVLDEDELFQRLQPIVTQIVGMSRAVYDLYDVELCEDPAVTGLADEMHRAAHDLRLLATPAGAEEAEAAESEPLALTAPYTIPHPHPEHWVLIGSLMEDLRRVRGRITNEMPT